MKGVRPVRARPRTGTVSILPHSMVKTNYKASSDSRGEDRLCHLMGGKASLETPTNLDFEDVRITTSEPLLDIKFSGFHPVAPDGSTPSSSLWEVCLQTVGFSVIPLRSSCMGGGEPWQKGSVCCKLICTKLRTKRPLVGSFD